MVLPYDKSNPRSIEAYAQNLLEKSLRDVLGQDLEQNYSGKGKLGQILEEKFFSYMPNSKAAPDFAEAGVELKATPIKKITKGYVSKERLVFNSINFLQEYKEEFKTSSFWKKNQLLLLMFYLHEKEKVDLDYIFKVIRLWQFPAPDLKIIKDDWEKIIQKIKDGQAHNLSEGDTFYLGACPKGSNKNDKTRQPFSEEQAMRRAFSLKSKYLNFILEKSFANEEVIIDYSEYDKILGEHTVIHESALSYVKLQPKETEPIVKDINEYKPGETFEELIIRRFTPFYGKTEKELIELLEIQTKAKHKLQIIAKAILGVRKKKIEEFEKADVLMKTICLNGNGVLKESMSFKQIPFIGIIDETWEESTWFEELNRRFFFVVYRRNDNKEPYLEKAFFWSIPQDDMDILEEVWTDTREKIIANDFEHFIKISDKRIGHVRPKGEDAKDKMLTTSGSYEKKKCFWLNSSYIKDIIKKA